MLQRSQRKGIGAVVLLHGLYDPLVDPFSDLLRIEELLASCGVAPLRSEWPAKFNPLLALAHRRRSFADELARALDVELRGRYHEAIRDRSWAILGHSGGGLAIYRWLTTYSTGFAQDGHMLPDLVLTLAAHYRCPSRRIRFHGLEYPVYEEPISPAAIVRAVPKHLVVFIAGEDEVLVPESGTDDIAFPVDEPVNGKISQHLVAGASHSGICVHRETLALIQRYINNF